MKGTRQKETKRGQRNSRNIYHAQVMEKQLTTAQKTEQSFSSETLNNNL